VAVQWKDDAGFDDLAAEKDALVASLQQIQDGVVSRLMSLDLDPVDRRREWLDAFVALKADGVQAGRPRVLPWMAMQTPHTGFELLNTDQATELIRQKLPPLRDDHWAILLHDGSFVLEADGQQSSAVFALLIRPSGVSTVAVPYRIEGDEWLPMPEIELDVRAGEVIEAIQSSQHSPRT
jgi:hypothetical protein